MPEDTQFPFQYTSGGDLATVDGRDFYEQHAQLLALDAIEQPIGESLTANGAVEITSQIQRAIAQSPYFQTPSVRVIETSPDDASLTVGVRTQPTTFQLTLSERDTV